jgi:hypothetical protein
MLENNKWTKIQSIEDLPKIIGVATDFEFTELVLVTDGHELYYGFFEVCKNTHTWAFKGHSLYFDHHSPDECLPITHWQYAPELP